MKNNKGFTMVEIIGAVIIMGILVGLIVPSVTKLMRKFRLDYYDKIEQTTNEAGKDFFSDNKIYRPEGLLESSYVNVSTLITQKYTDSLLDYKGKSCSLGDKESYTLAIYMGNGKYKYQTCIKCHNDDYSSLQNGTYCDSAWLNNENLEYDYGVSGDVVYFYYATPRDKIREKLLRSLNIVKYNDNGQELERIVVSETKEDGILPNNIDIIENKPILNSENKKEYELEYGDIVDNNIEKLTGIIYKHKAPIVKMTTGGNTYNSGDWTNDNVIITLEKNDNFFELTNTSISNFQWSINGGDWQNITCDMKTNSSCSISISTNYQEKNYKFRIITNEGNISDESSVYTIRIDKISPNVNINIIESTAIITTNEDGTVKIDESSIRVTSSDAHSGVDSNRLCVDGSCSWISTPQTFYYDSEVYIRVTTYDVAGNSSSDTARLYAEYIDNSDSGIGGGGSGSGITPVEQCTITYNANGGTTNKTTETVDCGDVIYFPMPTREGYQCEGWYTSSSGGTFLALADGPYRLNTNLDAYAHWVEEEEEVNYTLQLHPTKGQINGSSDIISITVPKNTVVDLSPYKSVREGYRFIEWCERSNGTNCIGTSSYTVTENRVLYVGWEANTYTIYYNGGGGTGSVNNTICVYDEPCYLAENGFTKSGYEFLGWDYDGIIYNAGAEVENLTSTNKGMIYLTATWYPVQTLSICDLYTDAQLFGTSKGTLSGNFGGWLTYNNSFTCYFGGSTCSRYGGYERICASDYCGEYKGKTAAYIRDNVEGCEDIVKLWCSCAADDSNF